MQVGKWGNSLAVRLPASVVEILGLKEGDDIEIEIADDRTFRVRRDRSREEALQKLKALKWTLPPGFRFSRDEVNERRTVPRSEYSHLRGGEGRSACQCRDWHPREGRSHQRASLE